jgi:hypothetical protein
LEGKTERNQFKSLLTDNLPGRTQVATKWSFFDSLENLLKFVG